jgi:ribosomal protein S18 acetylase RimI-like enzyme
MTQPKQPKPNTTKVTTIRPFNPQDKQGIIALMSEFGQYLDTLKPNNRLFQQADGASFFADKLIEDTASKNGIIYVVEDSKKMIGFIGGFIRIPSKDELMTEPNKQRVGIISEFFITANHRKSGIGLQLITRLEKYFSYKECTHIDLEVLAPNTAARTFYQKRGYLDHSVTMSKTLRKN